MNNTSFPYKAVIMQNEPRKPSLSIPFKTLRALEKHLLRAATRPVFVEARIYHQVQGKWIVIGEAKRRAKSES